MPPSKLFAFTELSADALAAGRMFDGLAVGEFTDMHGRQVAFTPEELPTYLANTLAAINATRSESGELAGLPVDANNHDKGDGAGWIVGAEIAGNVIRFLPKWTEIGRELISKQIRRFFSATVDTAAKVILGGTLTNWPATRNAKGHVMLRPIELADGSLEEQAMNVREAFNQSMMPPMPPDMGDMPYVKDVFSDYVIACMGEEMFKITYTTDAAGAIMFAPQADWVKVKEEYVEAARVLQPPANSQEKTMSIKLAELSEAERAELVKQVAAQMTPPAASPPPVLSTDLAQMFSGVQALTEEGKAELVKAMQAHANAVQQQAELAFKSQMALVQRENRYADLAQKLTGGTSDVPRAIQGATAEELKRHLLALPDGEAQWFAALLTGITKNGLLDFQEHGHGKQVKGQTELPPEYAAKLNSGEWKLADLTHPLLGLGDLSQYNLTAWAGK